MASFDKATLRQHILLTETLNLCVQNLYRNQSHVGNLTKSSVYNLLKISLFESFFIFDEKMYKQCDSVAMVSDFFMYLSSSFQISYLQTFG